METAPSRIGNNSPDISAQTTLARKRTIPLDPNNIITLQDGKLSPLPKLTDLPTNED